MAAQSDPLDFSDKFNTPVPPEKQHGYQQWARAIGQDPIKGRYDYDLQGAYRASTKADDRGHLTDQFKKPNHPTFSVESQYSVPGRTGGEWIDAPGMPRRDPANKKSVPAFFQPSQTNQQYLSAPGLAAYFKDPAVGDTNVVPLPPLDIHPPKIDMQPVRTLPHFADGGQVEQDGQTGYSALKLAPDPEPTAQSRWTRTPIAFGQTYNASNENSASTLYNDKGDKALSIEANMGTDPASNSRMLRHESIHALLAGLDHNRIAADPEVAAASRPLVKAFNKLGYRGDINTELPAYMGAFSNSKDEWTAGIPLEQRDAYTNAFANAVARSDPARAAKYRRMLKDSSPGTPAAAINLEPTPYRASSAVAPVLPARSRRNYLGR